MPDRTGRPGSGRYRRGGLRLRLRHPGSRRAQAGRRPVLGVDNDPQALAASCDNAGRNGIPAARLPVALPGPMTVTPGRRSADVVVANILAGPLIDLSDTLLALLKPGGTLLLSGLLASQAEVLCDHYAAHIRLGIAVRTTAGSACRDTAHAIVAEHARGKITTTKIAVFCAHFLSPARPVEYHTRLFFTAFQDLSHAANRTLQAAQPRSTGTHGRRYRPAVSAPVCRVGAGLVVSEMISSKPELRNPARPSGAAATMARANPAPSRLPAMIPRRWPKRPAITWPGRPDYRHQHGLPGQEGLPQGRRLGAAGR